MTFHDKALLKMAPQSVKRIRLKFRELFRAGMGCNLERFIREDLILLLAGGCIISIFRRRGGRLRNLMDGYDGSYAVCCGGSGSDHGPVSSGYVREVLMHFGLGSLRPTGVAVGGIREHLI